MIIELLGLPGSGKTTFVRSLDRGLKIETLETLFGIEGTKRSLRAFKKVRFLLLNFRCQNPKRLFQFVLILSRLKCATHRKFSLWINYLLIDALYSQYDKTDTVLILDQGQLQLAWSIFAANDFVMFPRLSIFLKTQKLQYFHIKTDIQSYSARFKFRATKKSVFMRYKSIYQSSDFQNSLSVLLEHAPNCTQVFEQDIKP